VSARFKPIIPDLDDLGLSPKRHKKAIETAVGVTAVYALKSFEGTVSKWKRRVRFKIRQDGYEADITTDDEVFKYQDEGTKGPYLIRPRRKKALYWRGARHPVKRVRHPGLKAQRFTEKVLEATDRYFPDEMERQIAREAAKKR
jgi:hypothetical protein